MRIREAEGKRILGAKGAPVPQGVVVTGVDEVGAALESVALPVMVKANCLSGRRWKAGLIAPADSAAEAEQLTRSFLGRDHEGEMVTSVLIEARAELVDEVYVAFSIDDVAGSAVLRMAREGGTEVEEAVAGGSSQVVSYPVDPLSGLRPFMVLPIIRRLGFEGRVVPRLAGALVACWQAFWENDGTLLEVNPLGIGVGGEVLIVDAKLTIDENALYRHPEWEEVGPVLVATPDSLAAELGVRYTDLGGDIAILSGGAGMTMAIADSIIRFGGCPANFLDTVGGADAAGAFALASVALERVASDPAIRVLLVNLSLVASPMAPFVEGFERAFRQRPPRVPVVGSVRGTGAATLSMPIDEAERRIRALGVEVVDTIEQAVRVSVEIATGEDTSR